MAYNPIRLTRQQAVAIRAKHKLGAAPKNLAADYGVSKSAIYKVISNKSFHSKYFVPTRYKLTADQVRDIRSSTEKLEYLAWKHGVLKGCISKCRNFHTYKDIV